MYCKFAQEGYKLQCGLLCIPKTNITNVNNDVETATANLSNTSDDISGISEISDKNDKNDNSNTINNVKIELNNENKRNNINMNKSNINYNYNQLKKDYLEKLETIFFEKIESFKVESCLISRISSLNRDNQADYYKNMQPTSNELKIFDNIQPMYIEFTKLRDWYRCSFNQFGNGYRSYRHQQIYSRNRIFDVKYCLKTNDFVQMRIDKDSVCFHKGNAQNVLKGEFSQTQLIAPQSNEKETE